MPESDVEEWYRTQITKEWRLYYAHQLRGRTSVEEAYAWVIKEAIRDIMSRPNVATLKGDGRGTVVKVATWRWTNRYVRNVLGWRTEEEVKRLA